MNEVKHAKVIVQKKKRIKKKNRSLYLLYQIVNWIFPDIISAVCNGVLISSDRFLSTETTKILDELFGAGYDRQIRPQVSGPALEVELNIAIRSMGPIDESKQTFALDCYFR